MRRILPVLAIAFLFCGCSDQDPTTKHQPANPSTWSPVGHKYVSIDIDTLDGRYKDWTIEFVTTDSVCRLESGYPFNGKYRIQYPKVYLGSSETPWFKFIDTLTITRFYESSDCPTYKMEY